MIAMLSGILAESSFSGCVIDVGGVGYEAAIPLSTFDKLPQPGNPVKLLIHTQVREDAITLFGFATEEEKNLFRQLIGVSGIGVASARMMLSSLTSEEIRQAILSEDIHKIKSVKGIGLKSAQRLVLELKDKIVKGAGTEPATIFKADNNALVEEATTALVMLGFSKAAIAKVMPSILKANPNPKVEDLIKAALKKL